MHFSFPVSKSLTILYIVFSPGMREGSPARVIFVSSRLERTRGSARFLEAWLEDPAMEEKKAQEEVRVMCMCVRELDGIDPDCCLPSIGHVHTNTLSLLYTFIHTQTHCPSSKPIYSAFSAYGASKLANLLSVQHMDRQRLGWTLTHPQPSPHAAATTDATTITPAPSSEGDSGLLSQQPWDPSDQHVCAYGCTPGMVHTRA